jgi:hypothetical protein
MAETQKIKVNFLVLQVTVDALEELAKLTYRPKGAVIDWLVSEKLAQMTNSAQTTQANGVEEQNC